MGYTGGRSILQNFLKNEYDKKFIHKDPIVRFETDPGVCNNMESDHLIIIYSDHKIKYKVDHVINMVK
jgi:hypothetical protein